LKIVDPMIRVAIARRSVRRASRSSRNVFAIVYDASIGRRAIARGAIARFDAGAIDRRR
jgi:hypothetical protein